MPMMMVYENCKDFIRTVPLLQADIMKNVEDIDTKMEDHLYDEACHICMARPIGPEAEKVKMSESDKRINDLKRGVSTGNQDEFERDNELAMRHIQREGDPFAYDDDSDNWEMVGTI
jgi:hypothetical protein